jgi:hypothetical protein
LGERERERWVEEERGFGNVDGKWMERGGGSRKQISRQNKQEASHAMLGSEVLCRGRRSGDGGGGGAGHEGEE